MITVLVIGLIVFIISLIVFNDGWGLEFDDVMICLMMGLVSGLFGMLLAFSLPTKSYTEIDTYEIVSLKDNNSIGGSFFLGCGSVNGEMKYVFYYKVNGGFIMKQLDYYDVVIKYTEDQPRYEHHYNVADDTFWNKFTLLAFKDNERILYVPEGTIKNGFTLDAE